MDGVPDPGQAEIGRWLLMAGVRHDSSKDSRGPLSCKRAKQMRRRRGAFWWLNLGLAGAGTHF